MTSKEGEWVGWLEARTYQTWCRSATYFLRCSVLRTCWWNDFCEPWNAQLATAVTLQEAIQTTLYEKKKNCSSNITLFNLDLEILRYNRHKKPANLINICSGIRNNVQYIIRQHTYCWCNFVTVNFIATRQITKDSLVLNEFFDYLTFENGTDRLCRIVGRKLHYRRPKIPEESRTHTANF